MTSRQPSGLRTSLTVVVIGLTGSLACGKADAPRNADTTAPAMAPAPSVDASYDSVTLERVQEGYPDHVITALRRRADTVIKRAKMSAPVTESIRAQIQSVVVAGRTWPSHVITVAFNGGSATLKGTIAAAVGDWSRSGAVQFDFWTDPSKTRFRSWATTDEAYQADIRISFGNGGHWSVVGLDARDTSIAKPGQATMNFAGFARFLPTNWRPTVLHEFGHALGVEHEHRNPRVACAAAFRWDDDPGYEHTPADASTAYTADAHGRRPGVFTYLGGPPNNWSREKVEFNMGKLPFDKVYIASVFDPHSIMLYSFVPWLFRDGENSACYTTLGANSVLSDEDRRAAAAAYPGTVADRTKFETRVNALIARRIKGIVNSANDQAKLSSAIGAMRNSVSVVKDR
ncbi:MAG: hypothetical protein ABI625_24360 [bacterium]